MYRGNFSRRVGDRSQSSYGSSSSSYKSSGPSIQGKGHLRSGQSSDSGFKHPGQPLNRYVFTASSLSISLVAGRLSRFAQFWGIITTDLWVLDTVANGYNIDFISYPVQHSLPFSCVMSKDMVDICDKEVSSL